MKYRRLGRTELEVSVICLGSMTWGEQNNREEAFEQLDLAIGHGVNFIDTAELYAVPARAETQGASESIIGEWLRARGGRARLVLASKVAGPGEGWIDHIREGRTRYTRATLRAALEASLARLQTDYLDLYQLHWPERNTNYFGRLGYEPTRDDFTPIAETLEALGELVQEGKIRHIGLSNESAWGTMKFLHVADQLGLPRVVSVQNPYSLLNRSYEVGLAEVSHREGCGLLAYSPLGFGVLTGKYLDQTPDGSRLRLYPGYDRYSNTQAVAATRAYVELARAHGLDPAQMALAWCNSRPFLTSTILGATSLSQLQINIDSIDLDLSAEVVEGIEAIHVRHPNPAP